VDPAWLGRSLAAVMIVTAAYHLARLTVPRTREPDVDLAHTAMGVAMAVMLLAPPSGQAAWRWAVPLAGATLWFVCRGVHDYVMAGPRAAGHHTQQALVCAAMAYMLVAAALPAAGETGMEMPGMGASTAGQTVLGRVVPALFIAALTAVAALTCTRVAARPGAGGVATRAPAATATAGCQLAMIGTGVYMLAAML
jgi:hypothetical protein